MKKLIMVMIAFAACAFSGASIAANDTFVTDNVLQSVNGVQMVTVTQAGFVLQYADGNTSALFPDVGGVQFNKLHNFAPAFKSLLPVAATGQWVNPDAIKKMVCQFGSATPGEAVAAGGDHVFVNWTHNNWNLFSDPGCTVFQAIKANAS